MSAVKHIKSARKAQGDCQSCGQPIEAGSAYKYWSSFRGPKIARHESCPDWRQSELATGGRATALAAQEAAYDAIAELGHVYDRGVAEAWLADVKSIVSDARTGADDAQGELEESLDGMPESLQNSGPGETIQERIDALDNWINELDGFEPTDERPLPEGDLDQDGWDDWRSDIITNLEGVIDSLELP